MDKSIVINFFMKIHFVFLLLTSLVLINSNYSQDELDKRLHVKGKVLHSMGKVKNISIRVIHHDGIIDTIFAKNGKYNLSLELNHKILIEFECIDEDHYTKRIAFNTNVPKSIKKIPTFDLTINLVEKELWKIKEEDEDILDLPVAYLTYDSRKGIWFDRNQQYSRVINKKMKSFGIY